MLIKQLLETRINKSHQPNCIEKAKEVLLSAIFAFDGSVLAKKLIGCNKTKYVVCFTNLFLFLNGETNNRI